MRTCIRYVSGVASVALLATARPVAAQTAAPAASAPTVYHACYLPLVGTGWAPAAVPVGITAHGTLTGLANDDHPQYLRTDGTRALTGSLKAGGFKITSLAAATGNGDAVRIEQAVKAGDAA